MSSLLVPILLLAQPLAWGTGFDLAATASASARPPECGAPGPAHAERRVTVWDRAKTPQLGRYCQALARGYSALRRAPERALEAADQAERAWTGRAGPHALRGRALMALGKVDQAWTAFRAAGDRRERSLKPPVTLRAYAAAAALTGHRQEAVRAYRALVPQAALLPGQAARQQMYVEAATWVMSEGPETLDEAVGYLTEARRQGVPLGYRAYVLGALALAFDRQGRVEQAQGVAAEAAGPWSLAQRLGPEEEEDADGASPTPRASSSETSWSGAPLLPVGEVHALVAMLAERSEPELAVEHWRLYLAALGEAPAVWRSHAEKKLTSLAKSRSRRGGA